jgi:hypothetical protein
LKRMSDKLELVEWDAVGSFQVNEVRNYNEHAMARFALDRLDTSTFIFHFRSHSCMEISVPLKRRTGYYSAKVLSILLMLVCKTLSPSFAQKTSQRVNRCAVLIAAMSWVVFLVPADAILDRSNVTFTLFLAVGEQSFCA